MLCSAIMLDGPVPENNFRMSSSFVYRHDDGYQCDLKGTDQGWALIVSGFMPVDERFNRNLDDREWKSCKALLMEGLTPLGAHSNHCGLLKTAAAGKKYFTRVRPSRFQDFLYVMVTLPFTSGRSDPVATRQALRPPRGGDLQSVELRSSSAYRVLPLRCNPPRERAGGYPGP